MPGYIDIHCHILPAVDDGSENWKETKRMLFFSSEEGIRKIIFTPHYHLGHMQADEVYVQKQFDKLCQKIQEWKLDIKPFLGNELYYHYDMPELLQEGKARTLAGSSYVLVEFSPAAEYRRIKQGMNHLQNEGYYPILAHVERYGVLRKNFGHIEELSDMGVYFQANSGAITGKNGLGIKGFLKKMLREERISFVGTDAHDMMLRAPMMKNCAEYIGKKYGKDYAKEILWKNPERILEDEILFR